MSDILTAALFAGAMNNGGGGGGGGGFTPTSEQLAAMNSGITSEDVEQISTNKTDITSVKRKTNRIIMDDTEDTLFFVQATQPTGIIPEGSIWINTAVVNP